MAIIEPQLESGARTPLWKRLGWLGLYWAGGVALLGVVAMILRRIIL